MTWFLSDFHWLAVLGVYVLVLLFAYSLCAVAKSAPPIEDDVARRRRQVRRSQAQIDRERAR